MIELNHVSKIYNYKTPKEVVALEDVNLSIPEGAFVLLMGPSGSGKSTLLSLIGGLTRPTKGSVIVDGEYVSKLPDHFAALFRRQKIGFIFQKFNLIEDLSVLDNVVLPLVPTSMPYHEIKKRAEEVMQRFSIAHKSATPVSKLSGGEQQRVAIARSLVNDPPIILADEPTANLDAKLVDRFFDILQELKKQGKTLVVATHDPRFERLHPDLIYEVREGHVLNP